MSAAIVVHIADAIELSDLLISVRANDHITRALHGCNSTRVCIAQSRAHRSLRSGVEFNEAMRRAVAWARCADGPDLSPAA